MYPFLACSKLYPTGPPMTLMGEDLKDVGLDKERGFFSRVTGRKLTGLIQCAIKPPSSIFLPALPVMHEGKMTYALCRTCLEENRQGLCDHDDADRELTSTWTTEEIRYAVFECGYEVSKAFELYVHDQVKPFHVKKNMCFYCMIFPSFL